MYKNQYNNRIRYFMNIIIGSVFYEDKSFQFQNLKIFNIK